MEIICARPWLVAELGGPHRVLSWSLTKPGFVTVQRVVWREVRNADLPKDFDALAWLREDMARAGHGDAAGLLTSRNIERHHSREVQIEDEEAACLATVGLSNAERVGSRTGWKYPAGTINLLVTVGRSLSEAAMIEVLSIVVEARTLAVLEAGFATGDDGASATGTGTDCIAIASPIPSPIPSPISGPFGGHEAHFAGKHTALGEATGAAVLAAMRAAVGEWMEEHREGRILQPPA